MDEYKQHLRRLAIHDDLLLETIAVQDSAVGGSRLISCARGRKPS